MQRFVGWLVNPNAPRLRAQPAPQVYEGCSVLYRGYIANVAALVEESEKRGEVLKETSDGELFAKAYHWWGEKLQAHVLGEYAVAVFDEQRSSLVLTHDSLGLVPVFYSQKSDGLAFASHLEDMVLLTGSDELDEEYLADYLATGMVISPRTPYADFRRLAPGQSLHWTNQRISLHKTWDIARIEPIALGNDEEYEERFRALLGEGVAAALRSDGKVWSELSGGLDSSSVLSVAAHSGASQLEAISIIYTSSRSADEREWMQAVVKKYSLPWHTLDGDEARPFSELPRGFCAEPISVLPTSGLFRRFKALVESHGVRVVLSGHGGDHVLCGDSPKPYYLADFLPFQLKRLLDALRDWQASIPGKRSLSYLLLKNVLQPSLSHLRHRTLNDSESVELPPWIHTDYLRAMRLKKRSANQVAPRCRTVGQQYLAERISSLGFAAGITSGQYTQSFEFRNPLLYRPLVEFMLAIPWEQKLRPDQDRYLQRRALKGILPDRIRLRRGKRGPEEAYFEGLRNAGAWTELLLTRPRIVERGYVDARLWREAVNQARFGRTRSMTHFIAAATLEVWLRQLEKNRRDKAMFTPAHYRDSIPPLLKASANAARPQF